MNKVQARVLALLRTKEWVSTTELCSPKGGANNGTRRLRELREMGHPIIRRHKAGSTDWEYSLIEPGEEGVIF